MRLMAASTKKVVEPEEESCGYTESHSYVVTHGKCREIEIRPQ